MSPSQVIVLATPVFLLLIAAEFAWGRLRGRDTYRLNDAMSSIALGMLSQVTAVLAPLVRIGLYTAVFEGVALWRNDAFWTAWYGWLLALVFYDLCYYWLHRAGHESAVFWAAHVVHHQSQDYNLSTALRQTWVPMTYFPFWLALPLLGFQPWMVLLAQSWSLIYQFWIHTERVGRLPRWAEAILNTPSHHRVHHGSN
jgi:sterol desaturase/sphingolipid hydroxylase (fatty acid hydroxylase superfamily)